MIVLCFEVIQRFAPTWMQKNWNFSPPLLGVSLTLVWEFFQSGEFANGDIPDITKCSILCTKCFLQGCHGVGKSTLCDSFSKLGFGILDEGICDAPSYLESIHPQSLLMETMWICNWYVMRYILWTFVLINLSRTFLQVQTGLTGTSKFRWEKKQRANWWSFNCWSITI